MSRCILPWELSGMNISAGPSSPAEMSLQPGSKSGHRHNCIIFLPGPLAETLSLIWMLICDITQSLEPNHGPEFNSHLRKYTYMVQQLNVTLLKLICFSPCITDGSEKSWWHHQWHQPKTLVAFEAAMEDVRGVWDQSRAWVLPFNSHDERRHAHIHSDQYEHSKPGEEFWSWATVWIVNTNPWTAEFTQKHVCSTGCTHRGTFQGKGNSNPSGKVSFN